MKKITFLLAFFLVFSLWNSNAQIVSYPYFEDFESGDGGWTVDNPAAGSWELGAPANTIINSADSGTNAWVTNLTGDYASNEDASVVSPVFDFTSLSAPSIEFSIWWNSEFSWDGMVLQSSIDAGASWQNVGGLGDPNNWYNDDTIGGNPGGQAIGWTGRDATGSGGWVVARHALIGLAGESSVLLRFAFASDGSVVDEGIGFDSINVFEVSCPEPSGITVANITAMTADITWTAGGSETNWEVVVQLAGTGEPVGSGTSTMNNNPYTGSGLTANTEFEVYVRSDCSGEFSSWVGPFNFITPCGAITPDYNANMAVNVPDACWDEANDGEIVDGPSGSGTSDWRDGTNYAFGDSNAINLFGNADREWLLSPFFDLSAGGYQLEVNVAVTNWLNGFQDDTMGSDDEVKLLQSIDGGTTWTTLTTWNAANEPELGGTEYIQDLSGVTGANVQFAIWASDGTNDDAEDYDFHVGKFRVRTPPTCPEPINLALDSFTDITATISWTSGGSETSWEVVVQPAGTGVPSGPGVVTTNNPFTATGLTATTDYEIWVRSDCGVDGLSSWTGPISFTTFNTPPPPPVGVTCASGSSSFIFTAEFDGLDGWTGDLNGGDGTWEIPNDSGSGATGADTAFSGASFMNYEASGGTTATASAVSPAIDLTTAVDGAELSFYMHAFGADMGLLNVGVSTSSSGPFTTEFAWAGDLQTSGADPWVPIGINLDAYLGQVIYVEFSHTGTGDFEGDMSIDFVRVETCGSFCIAPSSIVVSNVGGTTADINWNGNNGETSWEYVVVPAGTGEPSGPGTTVGTTTVNETGLDFSTDYEVWVRADCGGGTFSIWAGPINFTTTIQSDFIIDCVVGPTNITYCYDNNDTTNWTFTSSDGSPIRITFNAGGIESCCDDILIYDGTDNTGTLLFQGNNGGDLSGLVFDSIGDSLFFEIDSDGSVSCASGSGCCTAEWDFTVACATCVNPIATYQVIDDCANGDQFLIDVNVTSLGDATSLSISNNIDATIIPVNAIGVYQIGPFPFLVDVVVTTNNDQDANCVINSSPIQLLACPPDNDNPCNATIAVVNTDNSCDLLTAGSLIEATPSGVPDGTCTGDPDDDVWFQFVAENEVQLISILNIAGGTFNIDHAIYEGTCDNLVELECNDNTASVSPELVVGNTYFIRVFSGGSASETSTFDLCIKNAPTNIICENAENFCEDGGALITSNIIGIPDNNDIACLGTAPNPTWNIIQIGDPGLIEIQIDQVDDAGNGLDVDFVLWGPFVSVEDACLNIVFDDCPTCPNNTTNPNFYPFGNIVDCSYSAAPTENLTIDNALTGEIYMLLVTNFSDDPGSISISQTNGNDVGDGNVTAEIQVDLGQDQQLCGFASYDIVADSPFADRFEWYCDGFIIPGEEGSTLTVTECCTYTVIAFDDQCQSQAQDEVTVCFGAEPVANPVPDIVTCDDISGDEIEDFDLEIQTATLLGTQDPTEFNVTYHLTLAEAQQGINALTSPYTNVSNPQTIYVRIEDANATFCFATTSFDLIISGPTPTAEMDTYPVCDDDLDGLGVFDLPSRDAIVLGGQSAADYTVSYYATLADAEAGTGALTSPYNSPTATIFVRVESNLAFDCYTTTTMDLVVNDSPDNTFVLGDIITCDDASGDGFEDFDLEIQTPVVIGSQNAADFNVTYHLTLADAELGIGALTSPYTNISNPQTIFVRVENANATVCYITASFDLIISGPTPTANTDVYSECDDDFDGITAFDLATRDANILGGQSATDFTVTYYETQADADAGTGAIDTSSLYNSGTATIYVRVESNIAFDCYTTNTMELVVDALPNTTFTTNFDYEVCPGATTPILMTATANNYSESDVTINWYFEGGIVSGENSLTIPVIDAGLYEIEVINNQTMCFTITSQLVIELPNCVIPQGISPNGDGLNEVFDLSSYDVTKLEIFNRNGTLVYSKDNYTNEWYGQSNNGDQLPVGTYFYTMEYENGKQRAAWVYIQRLN
ncbi:gliding motility-associated C-terminal domain-containing protein [Psychroserpens sp.]|uniref:T9SS type B sorting domain-containing protein n=1 Tax=Psychroserpens sp. TaxID=2020870 RepID=UPI002B26AB29|nr:gliding motility-associated C-terminal domain-containing protein [Psychroserpens sp.]